MDIVCVGCLFFRSFSYATIGILKKKNIRFMSLLLPLYLFNTRIKVLKVQQQQQQQQTFNTENKEIVKINNGLLIFQ